MCLGIQVIPECGLVLSRNHVLPASHENRTSWLPPPENRLDLSGEMPLSFHPHNIFRKGSLKATPAVPRSDDAHEKGCLFILAGTRPLCPQLCADEEPEVLGSDEFGPSADPLAAEIRTIDEANWNPFGHTVLPGRSELEWKADLPSDGCDLRVLYEGFERNAAFKGYLAEIVLQVFMEARLVL